MNDFSDDGPGLRERLGALVPLVLIALVALGNVIFGLLTIWPAWQDNTHLSTIVSGQAMALTATADAVVGAAEVLRHQLDGAQDRLGEAAGLFLTSAQADDMLDLLYRYAQESGVEIARLQLDPAQDDAASGAFKARAFQIEVEGEPRNLLNFVVHVKEAGAPSVQLAEVSITHENERATLRARLILWLAVCVRRCAEGHRAAAGHHAHRAIPDAVPPDAIPHVHADSDADPHTGSSSDAHADRPCAFTDAGTASTIAHAAFRHHATGQLQR